MDFRLLIMRHAKSDWKAGARTDHERPLNKRGRKAAPAVGALIAEAGWTPDLVLCSTATRTRETWERMRAEFREQIPVEFLDSLYLAGLKSLASTLQGVPDVRRTVLALGHNPGWQDVVHDFAGAAIPMKTAHAALMTVQASSWLEASVLRGSWQLVDVLEPP